VALRWQPDGMLAPLLAALLASPEADAPVPSLDDRGRRWVFVGEKVATRAYVDAASVDRRGGAVRFTIRTDWLRPQRDGAAGMIGELRGDCAAREVELLSFAKYDGARRELVSGVVASDDRRPGPVAVGTLPGAMLAFACRPRS
jgi:hypothetical protein